MIVTGPSFTSSTSIVAPNSPVSTLAPRIRARERKFWSRRLALIPSAQMGGGLGWRTMCGAIVSCAAHKERCAMSKPEPASLTRSCPRSFLPSRCSGPQDDRMARVVRFVVCCAAHPRHARNLRIFVLHPSPPPILEDGIQKEGGLRGAAVEDDRYRTVVYQLDVHRGAELARLHLSPAHTCERKKVLIQAARFFWCGGLDERRTAAGVGVCDQRELRYDQQRAFDLRNRQVHLAGIVGEDAHPEDFIRQERRVRFAIASRNSQQNDVAARDFAHDAAVDSHLGAAHPLNNCP